MKNFFGVSVFLNDMTFILNALFLCISLLFCGVFVDVQGYRKLILWGLGVFIFGTVLGIFAQNFWQIILGRTLQGFGIAAPCILSVVVITDIYPKHIQPRMIGVFSVATIVSMTMAPTIISYLSAFVNWWGEFYILLTVSTIAYIMAYYLLPKPKIQTQTIKQSRFSEFKVYANILRDKQLHLYLCVICLFLIIERVFILSAHSIYVTNFGLTNIQLGLHELIFLCAFVLAGVWGTRLFEKWGKAKCYMVSLICLGGFFILEITMLAFAFQNPFLVTLASVLFVCGRAFPLYYFTVFAFSLHSKDKGRVQAMILVITFCVTIACVQLIHFLFDNNATLIGALLSLLTLSALIFYGRILKREKLLKR